MKLNELGWDEFFQQQVDELGIADIIIGRVNRVGKSDHIGILTEEGEVSARLPGRLRGSNDIREIPGIGDWVLVKPVNLDNMVFKVLDRKNHISRKVAGGETREQLVGANIDILFIVMGLDGDYNIRRIERYLFMVLSASATPVVILNKADLVVEEELQEMVADIQEISSQVPVHPISAIEGEGLDTIKQYLDEGVTISLVGSSGVGKSTLINKLLGEEKLATGEVRESDSKGRHVTTARELMVIPEGGVVIDNPGIREIQLWGDMQALGEVFSDIEELAAVCKFKDCQHTSEPGCAVKGAIESGELDEKRFRNFLKMQKELEHLANKHAGTVAQARKARFKWIAHAAVNYRRVVKGRDK